MGAVFRAHDSELGKDVALKHLTDTRHAARFDIEARLLSHLRHPRVVRVLDHFDEPTGRYIVMELVEGEDLGSLLKKRGDPGCRSAGRSTTPARPARRSRTCTSSRLSTAT